MSKKQKIMVSITGIFLVLLILVGLTYAYFLTKITGNTNTKSISVTTANLVLKYGEETQDIITKEALMPGETAAVKVFSATNEGNSTVTYGASLENITYTNLENNTSIDSLDRQEDLVYTLECKQYLKTGFSLEVDENGTAKITGTEDGTCNGKTETIFPTKTNFSLMTTNIIDVDHTQVYTLTIVYKNVEVDQSDDMNKKFEGKVNIVDLRTKSDEINPYSSNKNALNYQIINNAILQNGSTIFSETPRTKPAKEINDENERILSVTEDDYGTSYYYRGNVTDNYVSFADMCWRIVRIEGDGSVKLILASELECNDKNTTGETGYATNGAVGIQGTKIRSDYGYKTVDSNNISDYINSSNGVRTKLNEWIERKITKDTDKNLLKLEEWCIGDLHTAYDYDTYELKSKTASELITSGISFRYSAGKRIYQTQIPTYKCDGNRLITGEIDTNIVGLLTVDEIVFAGGKIGIDNSNYYINKNAAANVWWVISPSFYVSDFDSFFNVLNTGLLRENNIINDIRTIRPVISLKSNVEVFSGIGTLNEPYVIKSS